MVYHQRYDAIAYIPLVMVAAARLRTRPRDAIAWMTLGSAALLSIVLSDRLIDVWETRFVVPHGLLFLSPLCGELAMAAGICGILLLRRWALKPDGIDYEFIVVSSERSAVPSK
jgi:hypothetical protein